MPRPVEDVTLRIGENDVDPTAVEMLGDSLSVTLPTSNRRDSVTISFATRLIEAATRFDAWVRNSNTGVLQGVREEDTGLTSVYVPTAAEGSLIRKLDLNPGIVTPNGDGVNDQLEIRFVLTKVPRRTRCRDLLVEWAVGSRCRGSRWSPCMGWEGSGGPASTSRRVYLPVARLCGCRR